MNNLNWPLLDFFFFVSNEDGSFSSVFDLVMMCPMQVQCIFSYTILANPEVEPHMYQSKLVPGSSINSNKCEGSTSRP